MPNITVLLFTYDGLVIRTVRLEQESSVVMCSVCRHFVKYNCEYLKNIIFKSATFYKQLKIVRQRG